MKADLHCHTIVSDGSVSIDDTILLAKSRGITTLAITDVDSMASSARAEVIAKTVDKLEIISGVELSATDKTREKKPVSILCYLPEKKERLEELCKKNTTQRATAGKLIAKKVSEKFSLPPQYITSCATGSNFITPYHIMYALVNSGYTTSIFGDLYNSLFVDKESKDYINATPVFYPPEKVIDQINDAGGIVVLSNIVQNDSFDLLDELIEKNLIDGIEVWNPSYSKEDSEKLEKIAKDNGLLMIGGTNFRGAFNTEPICIGDCETPQANVNELLTYKAKKARRKK